MRRFLSMLLCLAMLVTCLPTVSFAASTTTAPTGGIEGLEEYLKYSVSLTTDGYIGIPVDIYTYHNNNTTNESPVIVYVINTNTERVGKGDDATIITGMMNRGYPVVVLDYKNNASSVCPDLDWSVQALRTRAKNGEFFNNTLTYKSSTPWAKSNGYDARLTYVVPQGYDIALDQLYWSMDKHGANGTLDYIVNVWNNDFVNVFGKSSGSGYSSGWILDENGLNTSTNVGSLEVEDIYDCVQRDGTPIDLDLRMDIIYPVNPDNEVPVYICNSSAETRVGTWTDDTRPHLSGFLFAGYAGAIFDYPYVPMARTDNWGYFDGAQMGSSGGITGDNSTYSVAVYNQSKSDTAAVRYLRYLADKYPETYKFDVDKFGVYGNSKGGCCTKLGEPHPELLNEDRFFDGHYGETRYEAKQKGEAYEYSDAASNAKNTTDPNNGEKIIAEPEAQPWLTYTDGTPIPSNVQFVYANCGGGVDTITSEHAPTYASGSMQDGSYYGFYSGIVRACRSANVPCVYLAMPDLGHALVYGKDKDYGLDGYKVLFDMAHYYLKGSGPVFEYLDMGDTYSEIDPKQEFVFKFSGSIPETEIQKITFTDKATNTAAEGSWTSSLGNTEWVFKPTALTGGATYTINVPTTIKGDNGAALQNSKTQEFTVRPEKVLAPTAIAGDSGLTLTKTAETDDAVYALYKGVDFANSTTTHIRFNVTNDAANTVLVYGVSNIDEANLTNSTQGNLLGTIYLTGAGDYELDVTDYTKSLSSQNAAFILRAGKVKRVATLADFNFDNLTAGTTSASGLGISSEASYVVSDEKSQSGSNSLKYNYTKENNYKNHNYHWWINGRVSIGSIYGTSYGLSNFNATDLGRKFNISFKLYDDVSRYITYGATPLDSSSLNIVTTKYPKTVNTTTTAGEWETYSFDWRIEDENDIALGSTSSQLIIGSTLEKGKTGNLYLDDYTLSEITTEVALASASDAFAPSLVTQPATKTTLTAQSLAFAESGTNADRIMSTDDGVFFSGRSNAVDSSAAKTYIKLDLSSYTSGQAYFGFKTSEDSHGKIKIYAMADKALSDSWSASSLNYYNAPANDRFGYGVDESKMLDEAPIGEFEIDGEGEYSVDVTQYAMRMKALGSDSATLVIVNEEQISDVIKNWDMTNSIPTGIGGGGIHSHGKTVDADHTDGTGHSYKIAPSTYGYERVKLDIFPTTSLSSKDVGRKFRLTYYVKANNPVTFQNSLLAYNGANDHKQAKQQTIAVADEWQKMTYEFELTQVIDGTDAEKKADGTGSIACVNFQNLKNSLTESYAGNVLYIDDMVLEELGVGNVTIIPTTDIQTDTVVASENFDDWSSISYNLNADAGVADGIVGGSGFETSSTATPYATKVELVSGDDASSGTGKSLKFTPNKSYNRLQIPNIFDHVLTSDDVGREVTISFRAKVTTNDTDSDTTFSYGLLSRIDRSKTTATDSSGNAQHYLTDVYDAETNPTGDKPDAKDYSQSLYNGKTATIEAADLGKWKTYSMDITVTEDMLPKTVHDKWSNTERDYAIAVLGIIPSGKILTMTNGEVTKDNEIAIYLDDILVTEKPTADGETTVKTPYAWSQNFESTTTYDASGATGLGGWTYGYYNSTDGTWYNKKTNSTATGSKAIDGWINIVSEDNYTANGSKSLKGYAISYWCRMGIKNMTNGNLTKDDIGQKYTVTFMLKADRTGTFSIGLSRTTYKDGTIQQPSTIKVEEANVWKKYTYSFTVTEDILNTIYTDKDGNTFDYGQFSVLYLCATSDFGVKHSIDADTGLYTITNPVTFYIDDIYVSEYVEGAGSVLPVSEAASVSASGASTSKLSAIGSDPDVEPKFIRKAYVRFNGGEYADAQKATLVLSLANAAGKTFKVWGLTEKYPDGLTYNNAPNNASDESIANSYSGVVPLATVTPASDGEYTVDVTKYVKAYADDGYTFALTNEQAGGSEYITLTFDASSPFTSGVDYAAYGDASISVAGGKLTASSKAVNGGVKLYNVFGADGASLVKGEKYSISMDIVSDADATVTVGIADKDNNLTYSPTFSATAGTTKNILFSYIAGADDAKMNSIVVYTDAASGFAIDNVMVSSRNAIDVSSASLLVETPDESATTPDTPTNTAKLTVSVEGDGAVTDTAGGTYPVDNKSVELNTAFTLTATPSANYEFAYWLDLSSQRIISDEATYSFTIANDKKISAVFVNSASETKTVVFKNKNNQIIQKNEIDSTQSVTVPADPYYMGYVFKGWKLDGTLTEIKANDTIAYADVADSLVTYVAYYEKGDGKYLLTLKNGTATPEATDSMYAYDTKITVSANPAADEGSIFSHWLKDSEVVSYDRTYSFFMAAADTTVKAVYETTAAVAEPVIAMSAPVVLSGQGRIAFFAERNLYADATNGRELIETGIIVDPTGTKDDFGFDTGILKATSTSTNGKGQFTVRKAGLHEGDVVRARAYMIYREGGVVKTVFSNVVSETYSAE